MLKYIIYISLDKEVNRRGCTLFLQVCRVPEDIPVPEPASEPHDETQRHPTVHLQRVWDGVHPVAPPETAHAHSQSRFHYESDDQLSILSFFWGHQTVKSIHFLVHILDCVSMAQIVFFFCFLHVILGAVSKQFPLTIWFLKLFLTPIFILIFTSGSHKLDSTLFDVVWEVV